MKIGMMSLWNAANGPSIHAEYVRFFFKEIIHIIAINEQYTYLHASDEISLVRGLEQ